MKAGNDVTLEVELKDDLGLYDQVIKRIRWMPWQ